MAQKLKNEVRQAIIDAAKEEFLEKGYEDASMRSIAEKAGITVGNIYRYFDNKEDLSSQIIAQTSEDMDLLLSSFRVESLSKQPRVFDMGPNNEELDKMMGRFADRMIRLYYEKRSEFNILLNSSELNQKIKNWFSKTFMTLINQKYSYIDRSQSRELLAKAYSEAVFAGMKDIFTSDIKDKAMLDFVLKSFLSHFITMVNEEKVNRDPY